MDVPKKWWWLVGVAVPIVVPAIAIVPDVLSKDGGGGGETFTVIGTQVNDPVTFNNFSVVVEQARRAGAALPDSVREILREAEQLARSSNFAEVIALLESVSDAVPVPALFNNLGAAYWATGDSARAQQYFQQALAIDPDAETTRINLSQMAAGTPGPTSDKKTVKLFLTVGLIQVPNLEARTVEAYSQESSGEGRYAPGFAGWISPEATSLEVPAGTYKLKFAEHFLERVEVLGGQATEILVGAISIPNLAGRTVEVYDQESSGEGRYAPGFAGWISPEATSLEVPAGTYKLKFAEQFLENIVVGAGENIVLQQ